MKVGLELAQHLQMCNSSSGHTASQELRIGNFEIEPFPS